MFVSVSVFVQWHVFVNVQCIEMQTNALLFNLISNIKVFMYVRMYECVRLQSESFSFLSGCLYERMRVNKCDRDW